MKGRLIPQDSSSGIAAITEVFENYLDANNSILDVKGVSGSGPNGQVGWLTTAFKTLTIENVVLPGPKTKPKLIPAITLKDMQLDFTKDAWAPPTSSNNVQAQLKSPFGFPLSVSKLNMKVVANYHGTEVASLAIPDEKATTSSTGLVTTQFNNVPFKVIDKTVFTGFVQLLTMTNSVTFDLQGFSNAVAETAVGALSLNNIEFNVDTMLNGFNNFGGKITLPTPYVVGGTSGYTILNFSFDLTNPSNITITAGDINFDIVMNEFNSVIGRSYLKAVIIPPGTKTFSGELHLGEKSTNTKAIEKIFSDYLTGAKVPLTIQGSTESTKIAPLVPALSSVKLATEMTGMNANLISQIAVKGSIIGLILLNQASSAITLRNPLKTSYSITRVQASVVFKPSSGAAPFTVGTIDYTPPSAATVPAGGSITTDDWPVKIVSGGIEHLGQMLGLLLDPNKYFDVQQNVTVVVGDGYTTNLFYYQDKVPFSISIDGLPPIGISPNSLSSLKLPSNLTSITDPNTFEQVLKDILSGKSPTSSVASSVPLSSISLTQTTTSNVSTTTTTESVTEVTTTATDNSPTVTNTTSEKTEITTTTTTSEPTKTTDATITSPEKTEAATTTSKHWWDLPF
ncbi:hypothetical protein CU098_011225 [Rhizopus stolonifer]|uniref:Uncharacterized protein n=1 Tax=Rhizopus stolonifer TaxID=4846 RepID=A0A367KJV7_RHIST|nr:hypothetical protein CU098_011225 [Rhizopus stolonifer]